MDFLFDDLTRGRKIKVLNVTDEFTREALAGKVGRSLTAKDTAMVLDQIAIFVGSTPGNFKLNSLPRHDKNEVIISVPWTKPVTARKVNGEVVTLPRMPTRVFVSAGTQWDFFSPPGDLSFSAGGDKAPDEDKRVELSF